MAALIARAGARLGPQLLKSAPSMLSGMGMPGSSGSASAPAAATPSFTASGVAGGLTEKDVLRTVDEMRRAETMELIETQKLKAMQKMSKGTSGLFFLKFLSDLSPYLVLALVIIIIIMLISGGGGSSSTATTRSRDPKQRQAFSRIKSPFQKFIDGILDKLHFIISFLTPGYRMRKFFSMFSPMGPTYNAVPRPQMKSGRCDNLRWIQINNDYSKSPVLNIDGQVGKCYSAIRPNNIVWELDASKMSELYELPDKRQGEIKSNMTVTIPYTSDDSVKDGNTFFYPRCDAAYYGNDPNNKADMFEDLGTSCKMKLHPLLKSKYSVADLTRSAFVNGQTTPTVAQ